MMPISSAKLRTRTGCLQCMITGIAINSVDAKKPMQVGSAARSATKHGPNVRGAAAIGSNAFGHLINSARMAGHDKYYRRRNQSQMKVEMDCRRSTHQLRVVDSARQSRCHPRSSSRSIVTCTDILHLLFCHRWCDGTHLLDMRISHICCDLLSNSLH